MTTKEFITNNFGVTGKEKTCSSVYKDGDGNIFSYGPHYPLLFKVDGVTVRNVRGYSPTTQRHIAWSRGVDAVDIEAPAYFRLNSDHEAMKAQLIESQRDYIQGLKDEMDGKKRKDTQVYKWLKFDHDRACDNLARLRGQI